MLGRAPHGVRPMVRDPGQTESVPGVNHVLAGETPFPFGSSAGEDRYYCPRARHQAIDDRPPFVTYLRVLA